MTPTQREVVGLIRVDRASYAENLNGREFVAALSKGGCLCSASSLAESEMALTDLDLAHKCLHLLLIK